MEFLYHVHHPRKGKSVTFSIGEFVPGHPVISRREKNDIPHDDSLPKGPFVLNKQEKMTSPRKSYPHSRSPLLKKEKGKEVTTHGEEVEEIIDFINCSRSLLKKKIERYTEHPH